MRTPAPGGGRGRAHVQILASVAANLGQHAVGHCVPMSAYILPQLQHGDQEGDFTITEAQGSWFGKFTLFSLSLISATFDIIIVSWLFQNCKE